MDEVKEILIKNHQEHILKILDLCNEEQKENIINQIKSIDFSQMEKLYNISKNLEKESKELAVKNKIEPIKVIDKYNISNESAKKYLEIGENVIKNNKYAVVTMAGGQGTRLGHNGPKGTFLLNINPKPKYLFEVIADNLNKVNQKYNINLNWYIMTSSENNEQTVSFFEEHNYFNYSKENVKFFVQDNLPILNEQGKLLVDSNFNIKFASSGNGNIYKAMNNSGVLADMKQKGIEWVFIGAVDNVLLNMADPMLIGVTVDNKNEIASKTVLKDNPHEKVGVFCKKNNVPSVIEYSELSEEMSERINENGELIYGESHIMCNLYSLNAIEKIASKSLPYHSAHKKIEFIDENGSLVKPEVPNAYKYEEFIFDGFGFFDNMSIVRGRREEDFAPIKNKEGVDSPETAIKLYNHFYNF